MGNFELEFWRLKNLLQARVSALMGEGQSCGVWVPMVTVLS